MAGRRPFKYQTRFNTFTQGRFRLGEASEPGIDNLVPNSDRSLDIIDGVPSPLIKWAEGGYTVIEIQESALATGRDSPTKAMEALKGCKKCDDGKVGLVAYDPQFWNMAADAVSGLSTIGGVVIYGSSVHGQSLASITLPTIRHIPGKRPNGERGTKAGTDFYYMGSTSHLFATLFSDQFDYWAESLSHTRNLSFLKPLLSGPYFDLETIWDEHTFYEFTDRLLWLTGGIGREPLTEFYRHNFIFNNSANTELELISRTLGIDRVVDEFIFKFANDRELDWLLSGVPPTFKYAEIPFTAVVNIRDQGTALVPLGLMPEYLPFPYPLPGGTRPAEGRRFEYRVPIGGLDTAENLRDRNAVGSNEMFHFKVREVPE
ncbi:hypothetical protein BDV11DRAFT_205183 [Aspergillus similis]